jgi:hypothetical protein
MKTTNPAASSALARGDLENFVVAATPGGIEAQEKRGQMALVNSTDIPKQMSPSREAFEKIGFVFGKDVDELFVSAKLPPGWTRATTGHSMHSDILDEQGRKRVSVFYKAAFYDRRADAYLTRRYTVQQQYPDLPGGEGLDKDDVAIAVCDAGNEIYRQATLKRDDYDGHETARKAAAAWIAEKFPGADDPTACW